MSDLIEVSGIYLVGGSVTAFSQSCFVELILQFWGLPGTLASSVLTLCECGVICFVIVFCEFYVTCI